MASEDKLSQNMNLSLKCFASFMVIHLWNIQPMSILRSFNRFQENVESISIVGLTFAVRYTIQVNDETSCIVTVCSLRE